MSNLNLLPGDYNVNISNQNYEGINVSAQKSKSVDDEKLTLAGQTKTDYLKLAVGEREKQLEKPLGPASITACNTAFLTPSSPSAGFNMNTRLMFSEPNPFGAIKISKSSPGTIS